MVNSPAMSSLVVVTRLREFSGFSLELKSVMQSNSRLLVVLEMC